MRFAKFLSFCLLLSGLSLGASVVSQATCTADWGGYPDATTFSQNPRGCSVGASYYPGGRYFLSSEADGGISLDFGGVPPDYKRVYSGGILDIRSSEGEYGGISGGYIISLDAYVTDQTAGPERAGILKVSNFYTLYDGVPAFVGISDGTHTYSASDQEGDTSGPTGSLPFTLGVPFSYALSGTEAGGVSYSYEDKSVLQFQLFEADGVTPVNIIDADPSVPGVPLDGFGVPEASTFGMGLTATLLSGAILLV